MIGIKKSKAQQRTIKTITVVGERPENGQIIEIDGELDYHSGMQNMGVGTELVVTSTTTRRRNGQTFAYLVRDRNYASTFRVVRGVFKAGDKLTVTDITCT